MRLAGMLCLLVLLVGCADDVEQRKRNSAANKKSQCQTAKAWLGYLKAGLEFNEHELVDIERDGLTPEELRDR